MIIKETYSFELEIEVESEDEAIKKAYEIHKSSNDGTFVADGNSFEKVDCYIKRKLTNKLNTQLSQLKFPNKA